MCFYKKKLLKKNNALTWASCIFVAASKMQREGKMIFAAFQSRLEFYSSEEQILSKAHDHKRLIPIF